MTTRRQDKPGSDPKAERLKAALKANIARRKAQAKARAVEEPDHDQAATDEE